VALDAILLTWRPGLRASGFRRSLEFAVVLFLKPVFRGLEPAHQLTGIGSRRGAVQ
jgi:hypothetical protein